jgi:N-acetylglutamate synthase-like GNAT family acetyltransferase
MPVTIRKAAGADVGEALRLIEALGYPGLDRDSFARNFTAVLNHPEIIVLLAEDSVGRVVGLASISHRPQLRLAGILVSLDELVVADEVRGQGVGRELLDQVKSIAKSLGARRLELETNRTRVSYQRSFYLKNGFIEVDSAVLRFQEDL